MAIKDLLDTFLERTPPGPGPTDRETAGEEIPARSMLFRVNRCFVDFVFPGLFMLEKELNRRGFWNEITIGRSGALSSERPHIKAVSFSFYPETVQEALHYERVQRLAFTAFIEATSDLQAIRLAFSLPGGGPGTPQAKERIVPIVDVNQEAVDGFLEDFIAAGLEIYPAHPAV